MNPFREALEGWTEDGWVKGHLEDSFGRMCLVGRFNSKKMTFGGHDLLKQVTVEMYPEFASMPSPMAAFNDHADTTFEDVVQVLEKAAVRWDEQQ